MNTQILTTALLLLLTTGCTLIRVPKYDLICSYHPGTPGEVVKNERIGFADTATGFLIGTVWDKENKETSVFDQYNEVLLGLLNKGTGEFTTIFVTRDGHFSINVAAGAYELSTHGSSYATLKIDLNIGVGEIRELEIALGGGGFWGDASSMKEVLPQG